MVVYILGIMGKQEVDLSKLFLSFEEAEQYIRLSGKSYYYPVKMKLVREE